MSAPQPPIVFAALAAAALLLAGCGGSPPHRATRSTSTTAPSYASRDAALDAFMVTLRQIDLPAMTRADADALGVTACLQVSQSHDRATAAIGLRDDDHVVGLTLPQAKTVVDAAVRTLCPESAG